MTIDEINNFVLGDIIRVRDLDNKKFCYIKIISKNPAFFSIIFYDEKLFSWINILSPIYIKTAIKYSEYFLHVFKPEFEII